MEYVPRGGAFERPRIYCTSMIVHIHTEIWSSPVYQNVIILDLCPAYTELPWWLSGVVPVCNTSTSLSVLFHYACTKIA